MHPSLSLAKRKFEEIQTEFRQMMAVEAEVIPTITALKTNIAATAISSLRATGIEGVYTGIEGLLKELLAVVDGGVFAADESWHAHLLAQAAEPNQKKRAAIISEETYGLLDRLRAFRHVERNVYRHMLRDTEVVENLQRLQKLFPLFEIDIERFFKTYDRDDRTEDDYSPQTPGRK
jgi:hypothetical protein